MNRRYPLAASLAALLAITAAVTGQDLESQTRSAASPSQRAIREAELIQNRLEMLHRLRDLAVQRGQIHRVEQIDDLIEKTWAMIHGTMESDRRHSTRRASERQQEEQRTDSSSARSARANPHVTDQQQRRVREAHRHRRQRSHAGEATVEPRETDSRREIRRRRVFTPGSDVSEPRPTSTDVRRRVIHRRSLRGPSPAEASAFHPTNRLQAVQGRRTPDPARRRPAPGPGVARGSAPGGEQAWVDDRRRAPHPRPAPGAGIADFQSGFTAGALTAEGADALFERLKHEIEQAASPR